MKDQDPRVVEGQPQARPSIGSTAADNTLASAPVSDESRKLIQPLPWRAEPDSGELELWRVRDVQGFVVLAGVTRDEAELIVQCVNAFPQLVSALREAHEFISDAIPVHGEYILPKLEAALRLASEGSET